MPENNPKEDVRNWLEAQKAQNQRVINAFNGDAENLQKLDAAKEFFEFTNSLALFLHKRSWINLTKMEKISVVEYAKQLKPDQYREVVREIS